MKKVAILQSNYIPWKGYFDIINNVDLFIFYDDLQYTKNDWRNRNKIKTQNGAEWLTIPVGSDIDRLIYQVSIKDNHWQKKHWKTLKQYYENCIYFKYYQSFFEEVFLEHKWTNLSDLNQYLIRNISRRFLNITTAFDDSRNYELSGRKLDRLINLLDMAEATHYVSGPAAKNYIDEKVFEKNNILLEWMDYSGYPPYPQRYGEFIHSVSILDLLFNTGPNSRKYIWGWRDQSVEESLVD